MRTRERVILWTVTVLAIGIAAAQFAYHRMLSKPDALCVRYHFDREGDDGQSCVVRDLDGKLWAVAIETAEDHELEAMNVQEARKAK